MFGKHHVLRPVLDRMGRPKWQGGHWSQPCFSQSRSQAHRFLALDWSVDDEASKEFMTDFYSGMLRNGLDPSEALRRSRIKMMRAPRTAQPHYWASFTTTSAASTNAVSYLDVRLPRTTLSDGFAWYHGN
jgi:hypothetical protein